MNPIVLLKKLRHRMYIAYYRKLPIQNNKIIMWANSFKQYGCSPKYISEYICRNLPNKYDIVWVFEPQVEVPEGLEEKVRIVRYFSMDYLKELHTAKVVVCNMRTSDAYYWYKRKEQLYIQTWHSSIRLKKIEKDAEQCFDEKYIAAAQEDSKKIDLLLSGCDFSTRIFEQSFWYNGDILKSGTPRCDILLTNPEIVKSKVYEYYKIDRTRKILLYAPTFRKNCAPDLHNLNLLEVCRMLEKQYGGEWTILYRFHPNIVVQYEDASEAWINATKYPDMQELLVASDILVTDYSSCMFDMALAKKICILYTPDLDEYMKGERGLYFDIEELPFPVARTNDEMMRIITEFDAMEYQTILSTFIKKIGSYEKGNATEQVVAYIENAINKSKK